MASLKSVCLSVLSGSNFENLFGMQIHLQSI